MTTKTPREKIQLIIAQSRPNTLLAKYDDADFEYMKDQIIALLEEARQEERKKNKNFYNGVTEYIRIHSPSPEEIQNYIDNNLPEF